ncbi:HTTM domain-containing protein [Mesonia sp. K7]|uniref:HTTM domain-containing protein n=1 Tax=Mesonia sp. K7 TaxID=2218606 RepID=UPI000DA87311|nr:HTTM domain-containing protein [Mesonia sp. K7]PZD79488.1 HTTM domain-containing protein [Mesonia sp. K7]
MSLVSHKYFQESTDAAPLAAFRVFFGFMMMLSLLRFTLNGWIDKLYLQPKFHFSYIGFEWIKPLGNYTYVVFAICFIAALLVMLGYKYRIAIVLFFLSFTYIELMDKTTYLNHYYFISILSFLMIFLPASAFFSLDAKLNPSKSYQQIPKWTIDSIKLLICIVYFYAGLAKLNSDWLLEAMPLKIWLPSKYDIPFLGDFFQQTWTHYVFSWLGMLYDLCIPFLLLYQPTRKIAFVLVVVFHVLTRVLFPIGMFPYIMIVSVTIFFGSGFHHQVLQRISKFFKINYQVFMNEKQLVFNKIYLRITKPILIVFFAIQFLFPWRYLLYPGELFWTEEGYRFSWRVMLMEKAGYAHFKIVNTNTGKNFYVDNSQFLTTFQEKQMAFQPDFMVEYAHYLADHFQKKEKGIIEVYVESYVALNGRKSQPYINPNLNLLHYKNDFQPRSYILPFNDEIKGL